LTSSDVVLSFEADHTRLSVLAQGEVRLLVSPSLLARRHWPDRRPTSLLLELAIDDVEAAIDMAKIPHAERGLLLATASVTALVSLLSTSSSDVSRDLVEEAFSKLVAESHERGAKELAQTLNGEHAAALLILREILHHLGFHGVRAFNVVSRTV
jgi:hypothetical protein